MAQNPYTTLFGMEPKESIRRTGEERMILDSFTADDTTQMMYMITGVRGSGKTVLLTDVANRLREEKEWIVVEISSEGDILLKIAAALSAENKVARIFQNASINLSAFGLGVEVKGSAQTTSMEITLGKMFESLKKQKKRVLITIDEVVKSPGMKEFASAYQLYIRKKLPVFLLMTGLHENIEDLQKEKNLTFLYRAPRIVLTPLNITAVMENYKKRFGVDREKALEMARMTKGYPYAFQSLGYYVWENKKRLDDTILPELRKQLEEYVYDIIWERLSDKDRLVAYGIAKTPSGKTAEIRKEIGLEPNEFNPYRKRLIKKGLINGKQWGVVTFTLPYFREYIIDMYEGIDY